MYAKEKMEELFGINTIAGIELAFYSTENFELNFIHVKRSKSFLQTVESGSQINSVEELAKRIPKDLPVSVAITGKGIIHKKVSDNPTDTDKSLLHKVLPNANPVDFYLQKSEPFNNSLYISIIRKTAIDNILIEFKKHGFEIIRIGLGPFSLNSIIPLLDENSYNFTLEFLTHKIQITDSRIENYEIVEKVTSDSVMIGKEKIRPELVIPFSTAFHYLIGEKSNSLIIPAIEESNADIKQKRIFKLAGVSGLVFFFMIALINFWIIINVSSKKSDLEKQFISNQDVLTHYEHLKKEYDEKQGFFNNTGLLSASRSSFYADQLAAGLPEGMKLTNLNIYPIKKKIKDEEKTSFKPNTILISGVCKKSIELNSWIKEIKENKWIREVLLLNYSQGKDKNMGEFSLELELN